MKQKTRIAASVLLILITFFSSVAISAECGQSRLNDRAKQEALYSPHKLKNPIKQIAVINRGTSPSIDNACRNLRCRQLRRRRKFPMQSVYKFPIAMAVLHQVDSGHFRLEQKISFDKTGFVTENQHSPIRREFPGGG